MSESGGALERAGTVAVTVGVVLFLATTTVSLLAPHDGLYVTDFPTTGVGRPFGYQVRDPRGEVLFTRYGALFKNVALCAVISALVAGGLWRWLRKSAAETPG